jgi:hypothetical protein
LSNQPPKKKRGRPPKEAQLVDAAQPSEEATEEVYVKIKTVDKHPEYILARPTRWLPVKDIISPFEPNKMKIGDKIKLSSMIDGIRYEMDAEILFDFIETIPNSIVSQNIFCAATNLYENNKNTLF